MFKSSQRHKQRCAIIHIFLYHRQISVWKRTTKPLVIAVLVCRPLPPAPSDNTRSSQTITLRPDSFTFVFSISKRRDVSLSLFLHGLLGSLSASPRSSCASPILPGKAWTPEILLATPHGVMLVCCRSCSRIHFILRFTSLGRKQTSGGGGKD